MVESKSLLLSIYAYFPAQTIYRNLCISSLKNVWLDFLVEKFFLFSLKPKTVSITHIKIIINQARIRITKRFQKTIRVATAGLSDRFT